MTQRQVAALAVRVLAIYAIINSLGLLESSLGLLSFAFSRATGLGTNPLWQIALQFLPFCFFAAMGVGLWILADTLAYFMCSGEDRDVPVIRLPAVEVLTLAFGIIGIWFALSVLPHVSRIFFALQVYSSGNPTAIHSSLPMEVTLVGAQIAIGLILFFAARPFAERVALHYRFAPPPIVNTAQPEAENIS